MAEPGMLRRLLGRLSAGAPPRPIETAEALALRYQAHFARGEYAQAAEVLIEASNEKNGELSPAANDAAFDAIANLRNLLEQTDAALTSGMESVRMPTGSGEDAEVATRVRMTAAGREPR